MLRQGTVPLGTRQRKLATMYIEVFLRIWREILTWSRFRHGASYARFEEGLNVAKGTVNLLSTAFHYTRAYREALSWKVSGVDIEWLISKTN